MRVRMRVRMYRLICILWLQMPHEIKDVTVLLMIITLKLSMLEFLTRGMAMCWALVQQVFGQS